MDIIETLGSICVYFSVAGICATAGGQFPHELSPSYNCQIICKHLTIAVLRPRHDPARQGGGGGDGVLV